MASQSTRFDLPGFTLPLNYIPDRSDDWRLRSGMFHNALDHYDIDGGYTERFTTHREILMMQVMNSITEKPDWDRKVFDDEITSKWRKEIADSGQDVSPKMIDWIIKELQFKSGVYQSSGEIVAFDIGVVKSDTVIPAELTQALKEAVRPLENVPENQKDYHPGPDNKVVDLVHPSLFPVIYGRSHILPDKVIGLDDWFHHVGQAKRLLVPHEDESTTKDSYPGYRVTLEDIQPYSRKFQWMPCDIKFADGGGCHIVSYINNLHPQENRPLYQVLEKIIAKAIPLWDVSLTYAIDEENRINYDTVEYLDHPEPEPTPRDGEDSDSDEFIDRHNEWEKRCPVKLPEPGEFRPRIFDPGDDVKLRDTFAENGLQVIVKLANIELTPEKPEYDGGSWHVEGQLNEHICASAIYYYDSENITESALSFRQRASTDFMDVQYEQGRHEFLQPIFGFGPEVCGSNDANITQNLGSVSTHEGRLLTFPNILQHRVSPFSLADRSKPGHRKILALFLVDPHLRIISSANVPPQREDWWKEQKKAVGEGLGKRLPVELQMMVVGNLDPIPPITMDEAKEHRQELMEERKGATAAHNEDFETGSFSLCEH